MAEITRRGALALTTGAGLSGALLAGAPAPAAAQAPKPPTLTLLLVNDIYKMGEQNGRGGFARLAAIVKAERAKPVPLLYCHAGDTISPSLMSGFDQGAHIIELLNVAPPEVFVPGNHEFDFGKEIYFTRLAQAQFPTFAANMRAADGTVLPGHQDRKIIEMNRIRLGFFGLALAATPLMSSPGDIVFGDEMETVRTQTQALRQEGADLVVCVAHTAFARDLEIARSHLVDVLLTGHDHDLRVSYDSKAVMVESGEEGQFVTAIDLTCAVAEKEGKRVVTWWPDFRVIDSASVTPDPEALAIVHRYEGELAKQLDVDLAKVEAPLDSRSSLVRTQETAIGNLIGDAIRASTGADIAIVNGGGIRGNKQYPVGAQFTRRDVLTELPFGNSTVMVEISGADIKAALENGVSEIDHRAGRFPQISGMTAEFDLKQPAGSRVVSMTVGGAPLDLQARYKVASSNFLLAGGDGYSALARGRIIIGATDGKLMANEVMVYLRKLGAVTSRVEGRIVLR